MCKRMKQHTTEEVLKEFECRGHQCKIIKTNTMQNTKIELGVVLLTEEINKAVKIIKANKDVHSKLVGIFIPKVMNRVYKMTGWNETPETLAYALERTLSK